VKVEFIWIKEEIGGTSDIFPLIHKKVSKENFIVMSGDTIMNFDLCNFIDKHICNNNFASMAFYKEDQREIALKLSNATTYETRIVGLCDFEVDKPHVNYKKVVYSKIIFDKEDDGNRVSIKKKLMKRVKKLEIVSDLEDIHLYIFNKKIYNIVNDEKVKEKELKSIKNELMPFLINHHFHDRVKSLFYQGDASNIDVSIKQEKNLCFAGYIIDNPHYIIRINTLRKLFLILTEITKPFEEIPKTLLYTKNNIPNIFLKVRDKMLSNIDNDKPYFFDLPEYYKTISTDSYVCQEIRDINTSKSKISKSICGVGLSLGANSKIMFSILFDNVTIGKDCNIENSIIGCDVIIEDSCNISGCVIQDGFKVSKGSKMSKEMKKKSEDNEIEFS